MPRRWLLLLGLLAAACGGSSKASTPSASVTTPPTTAAHPTTTLTVEAQVEAAYLHSWDVYAHAMLELDPGQLGGSYAGAALDGALKELDDLRAHNQRARYQVTHNYTINVDAGIATVVDRYVNHSVTLDGSTRQPLEPDPNDDKTQVYLLRQIEGVWKVVDIRSE